MAKNLELTTGERSFLDSMVDVEGVRFSGSEVRAEEYRVKYGCDPCDACGPSACADCKACVDQVRTSRTDPFREYPLNQ